jgi:hypothetical protein
MRTHHARLAVATIAGALVLSGAGAQAGEPAPSGPVRVDLSASAHPGTAGTRTRDVAVHVDQVSGVSTRAATTATASAICTGCSGDAVSLQVLYLDAAPSARLDNVAVAWAQGCAWCGASAVSVQVVVVTGAGVRVPGNRALALNASCYRCRTTSAAYQLVVGGAGSARLSSAALDSLRQWATDRVGVLRETRDASLQLARTVQGRALTRLAQTVNTDLGSRTLGTHVRLSRR